MAQSFGSRAKSFAVLILVGVMSFAFAIWGVEDMFRAQAKNAVLSLGKHEVSTRDFDQAFRQELSSLAVTEGRQMPHDEAYQRGIHRQILQRLLTAKVIEIDADDLGIGVNSQSARDYVAEIEAFQDELTGEFSEQKLMEVLARQNPRISREKFEQDLIMDLRQRQTLPAINGAIVAPTEFAQQYYQYLNEQRKARVLTINTQAVEAAPEPTDEQIQDYIDRNEIRFTAPEYRRISMIRIENYDLFPDITVEDDEIRTEYEYRLGLGELGSPEKRSIVQITVNDEDNAKEVAERLAAGEDPNDIVALLSLISPVTYDDVVKDAILDPETGDAAFELANGDATAVLGSLGNWYAVGVTGITPAIEPDFDGMRDELIEAIKTDKAEERLFDLTEIIDDQLISSNTLEQAADAAEISTASLDYIDRSGQTQDGMRMAGVEGLEGVGADENLLTEIFTSDSGFETDLFETSTGGWAVIRVDDIIPSQLRPFDEVKEQAAALWKTEVTNEALDELMVELSNKAKDGQSLDEILTEIPNGGTIEDIVMVRLSPSRAVGPQLAVRLLEAQPGDVERGQGPQNMTRQIAVLTDVVESTDGLAGEFADLIQDQITAQIRNDINQAYQNAVLTDHPMREYPEKVKQTIGVDDQG